MYSKDEIRKVLLRVQNDPKFALALIASSQSGNQEDLAFLCECGVNIFVEGEQVRLIDNHGNPVEIK